MEYLYSSRKYILIVIDIFILSVIIGLLISVKNPGLSEDYLGMFEKSLGWIKALSPLLIMLVIFVNNAIKSFLAIVLGAGLGIVLNRALKSLGVWDDAALRGLLALILGVFAVIPLFFVAYNGIILGMLTDVVSRQHGTLFVIAATLPHGIIEIPMVLISAGIGFRLGCGMVNLFLKGRKIDMEQELGQGVGFYARRIAPLLFLAAMIETFVTPLIAGITI